ncbi:MAG TPA: P-II family nitrogen regulator [Bacteroidetes bacterium]|nr:P-II family nitrogen regulator [Bacteroidota bacterium]
MVVKMKEIKAFIRANKAETVIEALEEFGVKGVTLIDALGIGALADPEHSKYSIRCVKKYSDIAKLEVVCSKEYVHKVVEVIREKAYTGLKGDGVIYVSPVEVAVKIRTGAIGEEAL